ncbi:MAG: ribonuclease P protein component [Kiritimatiellae bacterium]|nr:ribonuclease P protein component [Kiritimatiellia bacterium]
MAAAATGGNTDSTVGAETPRRRAFLFPRAARIASRRRFEELYASPSKRAGRYLVAFHAPSETSSHRLGVTAAKRTFRDAWQRNRAKRLLRESFRHLRPDFAGGPWDLVLVARRPILGAKEPEVRADLAKVCRAAGLLPAARVASPMSEVASPRTFDLGPATCDAKPEVSP